MERTPDVTIITPAYNSEKTIRRCLDSCLNQKNAVIECIVVDDCSTDNTPEILNEYRQRWPEIIRVITQPENRKQGAARNAAFQIAKGEYVFFLDSDDWIDSDVCSTLAELARAHHADITVGSYDSIFSDHTETMYTFRAAADDLGQMTKAKRERLLTERGYFWSKLYRKSFLERVFPDRILFPEGIYYEDSYFNTLSTLGADTIIRTDYISYHYWQNSESTVHKLENQLDKIQIAKLLIQRANEQRWIEYKDILYYKAAISTAAALLYAWIPLIRSKSSAALDAALNEIVALVPILREGGYWMRLSEEYRNSLNKAAEHPIRFKLKQKALGIRWRTPC